MMPPLDVAYTNNDSYLLEADDDVSSPSTASATVAVTTTKRQPKGSQRHTRSVSFSETVQEHVITTCLGMTPSQRRAYWYSKYDMVVLQRSTEKTVRKMELGTFQESSSRSSSAQKAESAVGLLTEAEMIVKFRSIRGARKVVLKEQKRQRRKGISDAARIATLYKEKTLACRISAVHEALRAEQEVMDHDNEPKRSTLAQSILSRMTIRRRNASTGGSNQSIGSTHKEPTTRRSSFTAPRAEPDRPLVGLQRSQSHHHNVKRTTPSVSDGTTFSIHKLMKQQQIAPLGSK
jgi:hypothetical protein